MHELSIAQNIVDLVHQHVEKENLQLVRSVKLSIGVESGIVPGALEFSFRALTSDTQLKNASLDIRSIPFRFFCSQCNLESSSELGFTVCPNCNGSAVTIISGTELQINEIEIMEPGGESDQ